MQNIQLISKLEVLELVRTANIDQLQHLFSGFQNQLESNHEERPLTRALEHYPSETRSGLKLARLWLERFPDSYPAHLVLGNCLVSEGWAKRGTAFADKVSDYGWQGFYDGINASWQLWLAATQLTAVPLHAWTLIGGLYRADSSFGTLAPEQGIPDESPRKPNASEIRNGHFPYWYRQAITLHPISLRARLAMLQGLESKWGGSLEAIRAFAALPHDELSDEHRRILRAEALALEGQELSCTIEDWQEDPQVQAVGEIYRQAEALDAVVGAFCFSEYFWCLGEFEKAVENYRRLIADCPDFAVHILALGECFSNWPGHENEAAGFYEQAAALGHLPAIRRLGSTYRAGEYGCPKDAERAIACFEQAFSEGDLESGVYLASVLHEQGDERYKKIWKELAEQKQPFGLVRMADMHLNRRGELEYDFDKGHAYLIEGMHVGSAQALYLLGVRFLDGETVIGEEGALLPGNGQPSDIELAEGFSLVQRSAQLGYARAMGFLGRCYEQGWGVDVDQATACDWFCRCADEDPDDALQYNIDAFIALFETGDKSADSMNRAAQYLHRAANGPERAGLYRLAYELMEGNFAYDESGELKPHQKRCDTRNQALALSFYEEAAELGQEVAMHNLGVHYEKNHPEKAFRYYKMAAESDFAMSQRALGICYFKGQGVAKDKALALEWFEKALENGDPHAEVWIKKANSFWSRLFG